MSRAVQVEGDEQAPRGKAAMVNGIMRQFSLADAAQAIGATLEGEDLRFDSVSTDTRTLQPGALYVALAGERFDGHAFVDEAHARGAVAALVHRDVEASMPLLRVEDTRLALGRLGASWRAGFTLPLVAVTGSNGKTTVKEMIASILEQVSPVLKNRGNLNNDIGVPLTLLELRDSHGYAVIEMGANHAGEIAYLVSLGRPAVSVITNASRAHLEGFGSLDGVARAKGEIFEGLGQDGTAVINADDKYSDFWHGLAGSRPKITFGLDAKSDVTATDIVMMSAAAADATTAVTRFVLHTPVGSIDVALPLPGRHNIMNALAAAAAALALGIGRDTIRAGLEAVAGVRGRLQLRRGIRGATLIDDTYNANPDSLAAALAVLAEYPAPRVLVLGDMAELGANVEAIHAEAGRKARSAGVDMLFATGTHSRFAAEAFGAGADYLETRDQLIAALRAGLPDAATVLVKGSRSMRMERVVEAMLEKAGDAAGDH